MSYWRFWALMLTLGALFMLMVGDADARHRAPCRNYMFGRQVRATFDPQRCWDIDGFKWKCNDVTFDPQEISVK